MKARKLHLIAFVLMVSASVLAACWLKWRGFRATSAPSNFETAVARSVRNFAIPTHHCDEAKDEVDDPLGKRLRPSENSAILAVSAWRNVKSDRNVQTIRNIGSRPDV